MKSKLCLLLLPSLIFCSSCGSDKKYSQEEWDVMYDHFVDTWARSLKDQHYDLAFYGDSRVIGGSFETEYKDKNAINLGIGGDRTSHLIRRFKLIEAVTPKTVVLSIGGNDALSGSYNDETFEKDYITLLNMFREKNINVLTNSIAGITCFNGSWDEKVTAESNKKIKSANEIIKKLTANYSYTYVDIAASMDNEDGTLKNEYSADGCHFTEAGYKIWFEVLNQYI